MNRPLVLICLFGLPPLGGCIVPYASPSIDSTPCVEEAPRDEVKSPRDDVATRDSASGIFRLNAGCGVIELGPDDPMQRVARAVDDFSNQEFTLDFLYGAFAQRGSLSADHRKWLLSGASEYDRLSKLDVSPAQREDVAAKGNALRELAAQ